MEKAIKKAIEGGWKILPDLPSEKNNIEKLEAIYSGSFDKGGIGETYFKKACVLDPIFWQCLGKAEGWQQNNTFWFYEKTSIGIAFREMPSWKYYMLSFSEHLAEGKDIESFFNNLIK